MTEDRGRSDTISIAGTEVSTTSLTAEDWLRIALQRSEYQSPDVVIGPESAALDLPAPQASGRGLARGPSKGDIYSSMTLRGHQRLERSASDFSEVVASVSEEPARTTLAAQISLAEHPDKYTIEQARQEYAGLPNVEFYYDEAHFSTEQLQQHYQSRWFSISETLKWLALGVIDESQMRPDQYKKFEGFPKFKAITDAASEIKLRRKLTGITERLQESIAAKLKEHQGDFKKLNQEVMELIQEFTCKALKYILPSHVQKGLIANPKQQRALIKKYLNFLVQAEATFNSKLAPPRPKLVCVYQVDGPKDAEAFSKYYAVDIHEPIADYTSAQLDNEKQLAQGRLKTSADRTGQGVSNYLRSTTEVYKADVSATEPKLTRVGGDSMARSSSPSQYLIKDDLDRQIATINNMRQIITHNYLEQQPDDGVVRINFASLLTMLSQNKTLDGLDDFSTRQMQEIAVAFNYLEGREIEIEVPDLDAKVETGAEPATKKVKVKLDAAIMNFGVNGLMGFDGSGDEARINARGALKVFDQVREYFNGLSGDDDSNIKNMQDWLNSLRSFRQDDIDKLRTDLKEQQYPLLDQLYALYQESSTEGNKTALDEQLAKIKNLEGQLYELEKDAFVELTEAWQQAMHEGDDHILNAFPSDSAGYEVVEQLQNFGDLLFNFIPQAQQQRFARFGNYMARKNGMPGLLASDAVTNIYERNFEFHLAMLRLGRSMGYAGQFWCKSGEDRTGFEDVMFKAMTTFKAVYQREPDFKNPEDVKHFRQYATQIHNKGTPVLTCNKNAYGAAGLQNDRDMMPEGETAFDYDPKLGLTMAQNHKKAFKVKDDILAKKDVFDIPEPKTRKRILKGLKVAGAAVGGVLAAAATVVLAVPALCAGLSVKLAGKYKARKQRKRRDKVIQQRRESMIAETGDVELGAGDSGITFDLFTEESASEPQTEPGFIVPSQEEGISPATSSVSLNEEPEPEKISADYQIADDLNKLVAKFPGADLKQIIKFMINKIQSAFSEEKITSEQRHELLGQAMQWYQDKLKQQAAQWESMDAGIKILAPESQAMEAIIPIDYAQRADTSLARDNIKLALDANAQQIEFVGPPEFVREMYIELQAQLRVNPVNEAIDLYYANVALGEQLAQGSTNLDEAITKREAELRTQKLVAEHAETTRTSYESHSSIPEPSGPVSQNAVDLLSRRDPRKPIKGK